MVDIDRKRIGRMLGAFGTGLQGRSTEFLAGLRAEDEQLRALSQARRKAMFQDAKTASDLLKTGQPGQALKFLGDREGLVDALGGDPQHTGGIAQMIQDGRLEEAQIELDTLLIAGRNSEALAQDKVLKAGDLTDQGQVVTQTATGFDATQPRGLTPGPTEEDKLRIEEEKERRGEDKTRRAETRASIGKALADFNKSAGSIEAGLKRVQNLTKEVEKGNRNAVPSLITSLVKLGDEGSTVSEPEIVTALASLTPEGALQKVLLRNESIPGAATTLIENLDRLDPKNIKPEDVLGVANAMVKARVPSLLSTFEIQQERAASLTEGSRNTLFTPRIIKRAEALRDLGLLPSEKAVGKFMRDNNLTSEQAENSIQKIMKSNNMTREQVIEFL